MLVSAPPVHEHERAPWLSLWPSRGRAQVVREAAWVHAAAWTLEGRDPGTSSRRPHGPGRGLAGLRLALLLPVAFGLAVALRPVLTGRSEGLSPRRGRDLVASADGTLIRDGGRDRDEWRSRYDGGSDRRGRGRGRRSTAITLARGVTGRRAAPRRARRRRGPKAPRDARRCPDPGRETWTTRRPRSPRSIRRPKGQRRQSAGGRGPHGVPVGAAVRLLSE